MHCLHYTQMKKAETKREEFFEEGAIIIFKYSRSIVVFSPHYNTKGNQYNQEQNMLLKQILCIGYSKERRV